MEPGTYIAIAQIAFQGACYAVKTFRSGLNYNKDAERLVLGLEVERFRLHIWGENAGLAPPDGQPATLPGRLLPLCEVLKDYLVQIEQLMQDANGLRDRYGLLETEDPPTKSELVRRLVDRMQRSILTSGMKLAAASGAGDDDDDETKMEEDMKDMELKTRKKTTTWKRIRWAVRDLDKFDSLVKDLARRISKLNELMGETESRRTRDDNYRINMVIVGSAIDEASLELIRAAVRDEDSTSQMRGAVERKALARFESVNTGPASTKGQSIQVGVMGLPPFSLDDFAVPKSIAEMKRFITTKLSDSGIDSGPYYLLERKPFDPNISREDKARLGRRIQQLVLLLHKPKSASFQTPKAEGVIHDPTRFCWWVVFSFPLHTPAEPVVPVRRILTKNNNAPVSLLTLLSTAKFRPPLEQRLAFASALCNTLSELYTSGWLHKGIRSENILFPVAGAVVQPPPYDAGETQRILASPLVCGFDYSRHESEWATIDKARASGDIAAAIYRHPNYQGEAAEGYKVQFDMYSVGLVLVEIALWVPLMSFLGAKKSLSSSSNAHSGSSSRVALEAGSGSKNTKAVTLSADMEVFHAPHALELKKRVVARIEAEFGFRVGSEFARAVMFCLEFADKQPEDEFDETGEVGVHPALEFFNNVVVPLANTC
ncbi:prion-inhibition and propagation-domain-containing protein [Lasiosphaeria hispida]|uniref:Prion-inhibition and propagation-domain-containing protein n=1 Tax=Lasiosphaeria hispida TaxID=260671 RepID=A0AAJ0HD38_9PEZI|nr:prion-inhibition and propagation-domain-containing protein [Lasiosphaeria hispida]